MKNILVKVGNRWDPCLYWPLQNCRHSVDIENDIISCDFEDNKIHIECPRAIEVGFIPDKLIAYTHFDKNLLVNFRQYKEQNNLDSIIMAYTNGERVGEFYQRNVWQTFLDDNNYLLLTTADYPSSFKHDNIFFSPFLNIIKWFYYTGYRYLNFYPTDKKAALLGHYHGNRSEDYSADWRNRISNKVRSILGSDYEIYTKPEIPMQDIVDSIKWTGNLVWDKNHATSYLDYNQSAVNLLWDSEEEFGVQRFTEKTLKAILFSKALIFFIWYGPLGLVKDLQEAGFWFLNFEFLDLTSATPLEDSIYKTVEYLKNLRLTEGSNDYVYSTLLNAYREKLINNGVKFDNLLKNCPYEQEFLRALIK